MSGDVKVEGLTELDRALAELPAAFRRPVVLRALSRAARPIAADARAAAPRGDDPRRRGSKKDRKSGRSVTMGAAADSIRPRVEPAAGQHEAAVAVGPDRRHFYLRFSEFGTSRQPPRRFLTPAFEANKAKFIENFGEEMWAAVEAKARSLARQADSGKLTRKSVEALTS